MSWPQQPAYYGGSAMYTQEQLAAIAQQQQQQQQSQYYSQQQLAAIAQQQQQQQQYAAAYGQYAQQQTAYPQQQQAAYGQYTQQAAYPQQTASYPATYSQYPTYQSAPAATDWGYYQHQQQQQPQSQTQQATQMAYQSPLAASAVMHQSQLQQSQQIPLQQPQPQAHAQPQTQPQTQPHQPQPQQPQPQPTAAYPYAAASVSASYYPAQTPTPPPLQQSHSAAALVAVQQQQQVTPPTKGVGYTSGHYYTPPTGHYSSGSYPYQAQVVYASGSPQGLRHSAANRKSQPPMHLQHTQGVYSTPGYIQQQPRYMSAFYVPSYTARPYSPWAPYPAGAYMGGGVACGGGGSPCGGAGGQANNAVCRRPGSMMPAKRSEKEAPALDKEEAERERLAKLEADGGLFSKISQAAAKIGELGGLGKNFTVAKFSKTAQKFTKFVTSSSGDSLQLPPFALPRDCYANLAGSLKFTKQEIEYIFYHFSSMTEDGKGELDAQQLSRMLYFDCENPLVLQALFPYDADKVHFFMYVDTLSTMVNGTTEEQLPLLFKIYTERGTPTPEVVKKRHMIKVAVALCSFFYPPQTPNDEVEDPKKVEQIVNRFFGERETLSFEQFARLALAVSEPQGTGNIFTTYSMIQCFGLFDYVYTRAFRPIQLMVANIPGCNRVYKEGFLKKSFDNGIYNTWNMHWCAVSNGFFWYYSENEFSKAERVIYLEHVTVTRQNAQPFCFQIETPNGYRRMFAAETQEELMEWMEALSTHVKKKDPAFNRFGSFAPEREGITAIWYIDGKSTYVAMVDAIKSAKKEIFITDWFLSPELYMIREDEKGAPKLQDEYRLDKLLAAKASEGVKVYVLVWNETKIAVAINSAYAQSALEKLNAGNIMVLRHPLVTPIAWSHHQKTLVIDQKLAFVGGLDLCHGRYDDHEHRIVDNGVVQTWKGKDYYNPLYCPHTNCDSPFTDAINRNTVPRMAWHDIHMSLDGLGARDVAVNFIQRWNYHREALQSPHPYLIPITKSIVPTGTANCQVVRSIGDWSGSVGALNTETSIYKSYLYYIENAQHYIYIENQFFISSLAGEPVKNQIALALLNRIKKAIQNQEMFRIVILLPVHPDGTFKDSASTRWIMKWQYKTIHKGGNSIFEQLKKDHPSVNLEDYITFLSIRKCAMLDNKIVTEQIYVHSKMILIDDRTAIIGSCNINDRSMMGDRDSEIAVVVNDTINTVQSKMNGRPFVASRFVHALRVNLWKEHLGLDANTSVDDPIVSTTYHDLLIAITKTNTAIYKDLFPENKKVAENTPMNQAKLSQIRGNAVFFELELVAYEALNPSLTDVDVSLVGDEVFT
eukprot:TRINITY_DN6556_c0_g2_i1.p1 TRINITY_DN6556_c0_g2~~TRINITY_DN6556_c0_g2_i1.p1  ORF type:complete len:1330 (+),score=341.95 TRINITY_DN6556_c0_g2_i1:180-4169(+)